MPTVRRGNQQLEDLSVTLPFQYINLSKTTATGIHTYTQNKKTLYTQAITPRTPKEVMVGGSLGAETC